MIISNLREIPANLPCKILAVDDDPVVLELLSHFINSFGFEWVSVANGLEALEELKKDSFDIVVTDMVMPKMDGMELLTHIRLNYPETDVIVVTGHPSTFTFTDVIKAGAIDFITKPFSKDELHAKINRVIRERFIIKQLEQLSLKDPLTGLFNRRYFDVKIWEEVQRADRQGYDIFLALIDVDKFKDYNDTYGHQAGDELLQTISNIIHHCSRKSVDWPFRYGGDEFAVIIPQTTPQQALEIGQRLLARYSQKHPDKSGLSIGLAQFVRDEQNSFENDVAHLIGRADKALYKAKNQGRAQLAVAD